MSDRPRPLLLVGALTQRGRDCALVCARRRLALLAVPEQVTADELGRISTAVGAWGIIDAADERTLAARLSLYMASAAPPVVAFIADSWAASQVTMATAPRRPLLIQVGAAGREADMPDIVDLALDLLIDGESGIWEATETNFGILPVQHSCRTMPTGARHEGGQPFREAVVL